MLLGEGKATATQNIGVNYCGTYTYYFNHFLRKQTLYRHFQLNVGIFELRLDGVSRRVELAEGCSCTFIPISAQ